MSEKLGALTGLRFFAAALIVAHHSRAFNIPLPVMGLDHAVSLFFVLSGFILTFAYPRLSSRDEIIAFYATRIARLWPAHIAAMLLAIVLVNGIRFDSILLANFFMVHAFVPLPSYYFSYSGPSWSISVEVGFYLLFPLLIWQWRNTWWWKIFLAGSLVVGFIALGHWLALQPWSNDEISLSGILYINPLARLLEFVTGMCACSIFLWLRPRIPQLHIAVFTVLEAFVLASVAYFLLRFPTYLFALRTLGPGVWLDWLSHTGSFLIFPLLIIVLAMGKGLISKSLELRPLLVLGETSFSIYLIHLTIFSWYTSYWKTENKPNYLGFVICLGLILVLAYVMWKFVECPIRNKVKSLIKVRSKIRVASHFRLLSYGASIYEEGS